MNPALQSMSIHVPLYSRETPLLIKQPPPPLSPLPPPPPQTTILVIHLHPFTIYIHGNKCPYLSLVISRCLMTVISVIKLDFLTEVSMFG